MLSIAPRRLTCEMAARRLLAGIALCSCLPVSGGNIVNSVMFGTRLAGRGSLSWFSPDAQVPPTPLDLSSGKARIAVRGVTLEVERRGEEIAIRR